MRILHLTSALLEPLGGAEQYCLSVARGQRERGDIVTVASPWVDPAVAAALEADGIAVERLRVWRPYPPNRKAPNRLAAALFHGLDVLAAVRAPAAVRRLLARRWDAVHIHRLAGLGAALLRRPGAAPVMTLHDFGLVDTSAFLLRDGVEPPRAPRLQRARTALHNRSLGRVQLVYPNARLGDRHAAWGLRPGRPGVVVPHGWRVRVRPADRGRAESGAAPVVALFLGRFVAEKGLTLLLDAWGDGIPGAELWVAGDGPDRALLDAAVARGRVRDLGWLDDAGRAAALADADLVVLPSLWPENFPLVAAEALLAGLPVVSTTVAAPPPVDHDVSGLLVEPAAPALRAALERLVDPGERARLAAGAREAARALDFDAHLGRLDDLYRAGETR